MSMKQPDFAGTFFGQCISVEKKRPTGKRFPAIIGGVVVWLWAKELRLEVLWVWDGGGWMSNKEFIALYSGDSGGDMLVSKHSVKCPVYRAKDTRVGFSNKQPRVGRR